jgi:type IV pilus assembly protein PilB
MDGVRQVEAEMGPQGPRMEETLRAMVAVRPDALMLSAVPDFSTAVVAAQLASSLLVVAQIPALSAARGLVSLRDLGVPGQLISSSLSLVLGQRLVRTICRICQAPAEAPPGQTLAAHGIQREEAENLAFFKGKGCPSCNTIGYRGRRAVIPASPEVRSAIEQGSPLKEIEEAALASGTVSMRERCLALVKSGVTTFDEFARLRL